MKKYNCIDLFAGAGGLSLGFMDSNRFNILAHIEWEKPMINTLRNDLIKRFDVSLDEAKKRVIRFDIQKTDELIHGSWNDETLKNYAPCNDKAISISGLNGLIGNNNIDIIIGGPPCQAYSISGRAQDKHSMKYDYRNYLFESFAKIVDYYKPKCFVFENVPGMLSAKPGGKLVTHRIYEAFSKIGYEIKNPSDMKQIIYSSDEYKVPQNRKRVIIFGVYKNKKKQLDDFYINLDNLKSNKQPLSVKDAIGNLPKFRPLKIPLKVGNKNIAHKLIEENNFTQHFPRYNNLRDLKAMEFWVKNNMNYASTQKKLDFYTKITGKISNHNKYRNLEWDKPSPTLVSHLQKDGFMFIHPDYEQNRSITIREAAILQSFPNDFEFIGSLGACYKMIGNAVPVNFAKNVALAAAKVLDEKN